MSGFNFEPTPPIVRAFEKFGHDRVFCDFIAALQDRAVTVAILAIGQKDEVVLRWLSGRSQELLEIVAQFEERKKLFDAQEYSGEPPDDPFRGMEL